MEGPSEISEFTFPDTVMRERNVTEEKLERIVTGTNQQLIQDDIKALLGELEDQAIRDSLIGDYKKNLVDYTWEEMLAMLKKEAEPQEQEEVPNWRPDPIEYIQDLLKPEYQISIPEPLITHYYPCEPEDDSTDTDDPTEDKPRIFPFRIRHSDLNKYTKVYWQTREHVTNLRIGNDLAIITTLTMMEHLDYDNEEVGYGIVDSGGIETLLNLATLNYITIQLGALRILLNMTDHEIVKRLMVNQGVHLVCFKLLPHYNFDIVNLCSDILLKISALKSFRPVVRNTVGLEVMLEVAELPDKYYAVPEKSLTDDVELKVYHAGKTCLQAIKNTHASRLVRIALYKLGFVRLLRKLIASQNCYFNNIGMQMVYEASSCELYRQIFVLDGFMKYVLDTYRVVCKQQESKEAIIMLKTIYKCLKNDENCKNFLMANGLVRFQIDQLSVLTPKKQMKYTMACVVRFLNVKKYRLYLNNANIVPKLLELFKHSNSRVREYAGRIVAELSRYESNHRTLIGEQCLGLTWLFDMCDNLIDYDLLAHVYKIVMELSYIPTVLWWAADRLEVIPLLWAAVNNPNPRCIEYGCSALVPYIGPIPASQDTVRRIPGGLFDVMTLTFHEDDGAKAGAVALMSRLANEDENLNILVGIGFIERLFELAKTAKHPRLRYGISLAFGSCAHERKRSFDLGKRGAVQILVEWLLNDDDTYVQLGVVTGLWKLSYEMINCMVMIKSQIVERLTEIMMCDNECLHNSVAGLLTNMRKLAREAEYKKYVDESLPPDTTSGDITDVDLVLPYQYPDFEEPFIHID